MSNTESAGVAAPALDPVTVVEEVPSDLLYRSSQFASLPKFLKRLIVFASKSAASTWPLEWMFYDAGAAALAMIVGYEFSPRAGGQHAPALAVFVFALSIIASGNVTGLYDRHVLLNRAKPFLALIATAVLGLAILAAFSNIVLFHQVGRYIYVITMGIFLVLGAPPRIIGHYAANLYRMRVLLIGNRQVTSEIADNLFGDDTHHTLVGFCGDNGNVLHGALGHVEDIPRVCRNLRIDEIVITDDYLSRADVLETCFEAVKSGCRVLDEATFHEEVLEKVPVDQINERWFYAAKLGNVNPMQNMLKRLADILIASAGLLLTAPLFAILWALVRLTSPGPAIYSQIRCGRFGRPFKMHKFRSMRTDAERNGAQWAVKNDPRVTAIGRYLRKTRMDEIPQFWNVLRGDMSFVGPRPERPEFVAEIESTVQYFGFRHLVRPGITGFAQIRFQYGASVEDAREKLQYDLYYIKNWSLLLDIQIILRTIATIMKGAR